MKILISSLLLLLTSTITKAQTDKPDDVLPGWWKIPKTEARFKIGGYIKLDLIHDFNPINSPDFFDVSKIPTDGSKGQNTNLNVKETRLFIDVRTPSKIGEMRFYVEGDFYGSSAVFRLRHAYAEIGRHWLIGQTWSNFMDEDIIPPSLDFEKPAAYAFLRHPIIRWKSAYSKNSYFSFAVEQPNINAQTPTEPGDFESPYPDLTGKYRHSGSWGHIQLSFFGAMLRYRYSANNKVDNLFLGGGNLSGQLKLLKRDKFNYQAIIGPGASRYRSGLVAGLDDNGNLESITGVGLTFSYQHYWSPTVSSLILYNQGTENYTAGQPTNDIASVNYMLANVVWDINKSLFIGAEYLYGTRENISNAKGNANRIQFSARYSFNMN